jgi:hypothetical protein
MDLLEWMQTSVSSSTHVVLFWSEHAAASPWVKQEWSSAFWSAVSSTVPAVVPVRLDGTPLPPMIARLLYLTIADGETAVLDGIRRALMPAVDFQATRMQRLKELSGYSQAAAGVALQALELSERAGESRFRVYDFFYPPTHESLFLAVLRSTGLTSPVNLERKGTTGQGREKKMRLTAHLRGLASAFDYMERLADSHGFQPRRMG